ncbi:MAG TPA: hypothetical protein VNO30_44405 [Kofleriaceae bacterium]|nr:hypothetical protein [Kofleriaceae bacterium]
MERALGTAALEERHPAGLVGLLNRQFELERMCVDSIGRGQRELLGSASPAQLSWEKPATELHLGVPGSRHVEVKRLQHARFTAGVIPHEQRELLQGKPGIAMSLEILEVKLSDHRSRPGCSSRAYAKSILAAGARGEQTSSRSGWSGQPGSFAPADQRLSGGEALGGAVTLIAESPRLILLREALERLLGWSPARRARVDEALRQIRDHDLHRAALTLCGGPKARDLIPIAQELHRLTLTEAQPFVVYDPRRPVTRSKGVAPTFSDLAAALREAKDGTLCLEHRKVSSRDVMAIYFAVLPKGCRTHIVHCRGSSSRRSARGRRSSIGSSASTCARRPPSWAAPSTSVCHQRIARGSGPPRPRRCPSSGRPRSASSRCVWRRTSKRHRRSSASRMWR